jgi:GST-like protein
MLKFYFHATPNPMKVPLLLEELQLPLELIGVDIFKGGHSQFPKGCHSTGRAPCSYGQSIQRHLASAKTG